MLVFPTDSSARRTLGQRAQTAVRAGILWIHCPEDHQGGNLVTAVLVMAGPCGARDLVVCLANQGVCSGGWWRHQAVMKPLKGHRRGGPSGEQREQSFQRSAAVRQKLDLRPDSAWRPSGSIGGSRWPPAGPLIPGPYIYIWKTPREVNVMKSQSWSQKSVNK
ncbi:hypothetical protein T10_12503 [Trichinella papuae]|uniref:Uncharacterized protein n=1 Tax=Trichinella papuae TaxID=268474 RepID=A0A0V1MGF1_9BILA|nr:hypothetical protein T10_12503 [Trichinella papuae]